MIMKTLTAMFGHLAQRLRSHVLDRQVLENLLRSLRHIPGAGEDKRQRPNGLGHHAQADLVAAVADRLPRHRRVAIVVRRPDVHERRVMAQRQQPQTEAVQDVDHAGDAGVLAEGNLPLAALVDDALVVDQTDLLVQNGVEQRHVRILRLDGVREEAVGLLRYQRLDGHLLDAEDDRRLADVLLNDGAGVQIHLRAHTQMDCFGEFGIVTDIIRSYHF